MGRQVQHRRGTESAHETFTGAEGEITVDTTNKTAVVHDGSTAGGHRLATNAGLTAGIAEAKTYTDNSLVPVSTQLDANADALTELIRQTTLDNICINGNFADTSGWAKMGSTQFSVNENEATVIAAYQTAGIYQTINVLAGHTYYFGAKIRTLSANIRVSIANGAAYSVVGDGKARRASIIATMAAAYSNNQFIIKDNSASGFLPYCIKDVFILDITGTTLTVAAIDALLEANGYFSGEVVAYDKSGLTSDVVSDYRTGDSHYYTPSVVANYAASNVIVTAEDITTSVLYSMWDKLVAKYPTLLTKTLLGTDASGTLNLYSIRFKPLAPKCKILLTANLHGNGATGDPQDPSLALYELIYDLLTNNTTNKALEYLRHNVEIDFVPCANPWGYNNKTRENYNSVDLNRNFVSETPQAETILLKAWMDDNADAVLYIDVHAMGSGTTAYGLTAYVTHATTVRSKESDTVRDVQEFLAAKYAVPSYPIFDHTVYSGVATGYTRSLGIPSICTEFPVYATGKTTHGTYMMDFFISWIGNIVYRFSRSTFDVADEMVFRTPDRSAYYKISIDNSGNVISTLIT